MGKSEANTLLQRLVDEMLKKWTGRSLVDVIATGIPRGEKSAK